MKEKIQLGPEEAVSHLEAQVNQARYDLKENLLPSLNHGHKNRLLLAISEYPQIEADFSDEKEEMIKAYSALKICHDSNVALGVEMVMEEMRLESIEKAKQKEENNG